jgi:hypothetical protein
VFSEGVYDCEVDWGDGNISYITSYNDINRIHTYAEEGTYWIEIKGSFTAWSMDSLSQLDKNKLRKVILWSGKLFNGFNYLENAFSNCSNFTDIGDSPIKPYNYTGCLSFNNFCSYTKVKSIKYSLFDEHLNATSFEYCFSNNSNLISVCKNIFRRNIKAITFEGAFSNNNKLETLPNNIFINNRKVNNFSYLFLNTTRFIISPYIFYNQDEESTRFNEVTDMNFSYLIARGSYNNYKKGIAPNLWNCTYFGEVLKDNSFAGQGNSLGLSNYSSIPDEWRGY